MWWWAVRAGQAVLAPVCLAVMLGAQDRVAASATARLEPEDLPDAPVSQLGVEPRRNDRVAGVREMLLTFERARHAGAAGRGPEREAGVSSSLMAIEAEASGAPGVSRARVPLEQCPTDQTRARECRIHWRDLMIDGGAYLAFQNIGNLYAGYTYRYQTSHGKWFHRWIDSAAGWRWNRWSDGNPWLDDYVGHSMMGAITNYIWIENDPKGMTVPFGNTPEYRRRLWRAFLYSTAFSFQWKLGPLGEASIGHNGDYYQEENGVPATNETGWVELVTTPVGGALWTMGEDVIDKRLIAKWEQRHSNPAVLMAFAFLTPARTTANIFRFRAPWYRDSRTVHASGLFQSRDPQELAAEKAERKAARDAQMAAAQTGVAGQQGTGAAAVQGSTTAEVDEPFRYGGKYEFGARLGVSLTHDTAWGSDENNKYMDILVRGSAHLLGDGPVELRYSPEVIAAAMLDEPLPAATDPKFLRTRTYGTGISPEGFQVVFGPKRMVQPYLEQHLGVIEFFKPVLYASRPGWNAVYDVSFGGGMNIVRKNGNAISFGYRLQHLGPIRGPASNATDAHSFYMGISRFFGRRRDVY